MEEVRIGIIGLGFGTAHVGTIHNIDGVRIGAVAYHIPVRGANTTVQRIVAAMAQAIETGKAEVVV